MRPHWPLNSGAAVVDVVASNVGLHRPLNNGAEDEPKVQSVTSQPGLPGVPRGPVRSGPAAKVRPNSRLVLSPVNMESTWC